MEGILYDIWLSLCFPFGSRILGKLLREFPAEEIYRHKGEPRALGLSEKDGKRLLSVSDDRPKRMLEKCEKEGIEVIGYGDARYPSSLKEIIDSPAVLYVKGHLPDLDRRLSIAVVGTRNATPYYQSVTGNLSYQLAKAGAVIISGLALGADSFAHAGALKASGVTIGIAACGLDISYPKGNEAMREQILKDGAIISELPLGTKVSSGYFRVRNRLLAALSQGVLITQAPLRSGTLLTANHALEQNKDLFCVPPADIYSPECMGVAKLIRDGAKSVFSVYDILEEYSSRYVQTLDMSRLSAEGMMRRSPKKAAGMSNSQRPVEKAEAKREMPKDLTEHQKQIYQALKDTPTHLEEILAKTGLKSFEVLAGLTEMELMGIVEAISGQLYRLV